MHKLSYIGLAILVMQFSATMAADTPTATSAPVTATAPDDGMSRTEQAGAAAAIKAKKAGSWFKNAYNSAKNYTDNKLTGVGCEASSSEICGSDAPTAIIEVKKCHDHPKRSKNCFKKICEKLNMTTTQEGYDKNYIDQVGLALQGTVTIQNKDSKLNGKTVTFRDALICEGYNASWK